jgi:hypothetical protein
MEDKIKVLQKSVWNYKDIETYAGVAEAKAYQILMTAQEQFNGRVPYGSGYAKADSVLKIFGTSRKEELATYGVTL